MKHNPMDAVGEVFGQKQNMTETIQRFLDCPVTAFPRSASHEELIRAYDEALERGRAEKFVPVFVLADDLLWTSVKSQAEGMEADESANFDPQAVKAMRRRLLSQPLPDAQIVLAEREAMAAELDDEEEEAAYLDEVNEDWAKTEEEGDEPAASGRLSGLRQLRLQGETGSLMLAEIPVEHPWQVFAFLPFGGWNDAPSPEEVMAVSRHWFEHHRARPAVIGFDFLEFDLPEPIAPDRTREVLQDHLAFAPEFFSMGVMDETILKEQLAEMESWFFWWD